MPARSLALSSVTVAVMVLASTPAAASCRQIRGMGTADPADDVTVCRQDVWFHQAGTKIGNLAWTGQQPYPTFDTIRPTVSVQSGGGAAYVGNEATQYGLGQDHPVHTLWFEGTFTGPIDNVAVDVHAVSPGGDPVIGQYRLYTTLRVDGVTVYRSPYVGGDVAGFDQGGLAGGTIRFAFTNVYAALEAAGLADAPQHTVRVAVAPYFAGDDAVYLYDASEYPSGAIFNLQPTFVSQYRQIRLAGA